MKMLSRMGILLEILFQCRLLHSEWQGLRESSRHHPQLQVEVHSQSHRPRNHFLYWHLHTEYQRLQAESCSKSHRPRTPHPPHQLVRNSRCHRGRWRRAIQIYSNHRLPSQPLLPHHYQPPPPFQPVAYPLRHQLLLLAPMSRTIETYSRARRLYHGRRWTSSKILGLEGSKIMHSLHMSTSTPYCTSGLLCLRIDLQMLKTTCCYYLYRK